jgi:arsenite methyltransferase
MATKPDYGIDAPGVIRNFFLLAIVLLVTGYFLPIVHLGSVTLKLRPMLWTPAIFFLMQGLLMLLYAKVGKFQHRDRMLNSIVWRGDELVLDVGTGRGLLAVGAARRLRTGKAVGIDIWKASDLSDNSFANTMKNVELEGVKDRVEIRNEDATKMSFAEATFDVVVSNLCLHNIPTADGRAQACREIARVLRPGGTALISDFQKTADYAKTFSALGLETNRGAPRLLDTFPPLRVVKVVKT